MDGTGQEQDTGHLTGHPLPDQAREDDVPESLREKKGSSDDTAESELGGGRLSSAEGRQAVRNQSVVDPDAYAGSSESGV